MNKLTLNRRGNRLPIEEDADLDWDFTPDECASFDSDEGSDGPLTLCFTVLDEEGHPIDEVGDITNQRILREVANRRRMNDRLNTRDLDFNDEQSNWQRLSSLDGYDGYDS